MVERGSRSRGRPTVEERAAQRERLSSDGSDRYARLILALRQGRPEPMGRERSYPLRWHPIARKLLIAAITIAIAYLSVRVGLDLIRERRIDTWAGPDTTVQSGQRLAGCPAIDSLNDNVFPSWIRYGGRVYALGNQLRPVVDSRSSPGPAESGYTLGEMRLLLDNDTPAGRSRDIVILVLPTSRAGQVFRVVPDCT
ncbi:MAG: hypothetical protein H0W07_06425 [Chloroflexi bacterium]|nr:hypothetical protein [Chloroflexota bacterium]